MRVPWVRLFESKTLSEDLIAMMLVDKYEGSYRVDGIGGDGGRDVVRDADDELTIWEIKGFPDRLSKSRTRKAQIEKSLLEAAKLQPDHWWLVLPLDFTPSELAWFTRLKRDFTFIAGYRGLTWLDAQFAKRQDLVRHTQDIDGELLRAIAEHRAERDMLSGVPDLAARAAALANRANEMSPSFALGFAAAPDGSTRIDITAKPGADPVTVDVEIDAEQLGEDERAQFEDRVVHGRPGEVRLDSRAVRSLRLTGMDELGLSSLQLRPGGALVLSPIVEDIDMTAQVSVHEPGGFLPVATLPFRLRERGNGFLSATLIGQDYAGLMELSLRGPQPRPGATLRPEDIHCELRFIGGADALPAAAAPVARLMAAAHAPNQIKMRIDGEPVGVANSPVLSEDDQERLSRGAAAIGDLAVIQELTGVAFPVPDAFSKNDARMLAAARGLLLGDEVEWFRGTLTMTIDSGKVDDFLNSFDADGEFAIAWSQLGVLEYEGHRIELGPIGVNTPHAMLRNARQIRRRKPSMGDPTAVITPRDGFFIARRIEAASDEWGRVMSAPAGTPPYSAAAPPDPSPEPTGA